MELKQRLVPHCRLRAPICEAVRCDHHPSHVNVLDSSFTDHQHASRTNSTVLILRQVQSTERRPLPSSTTISHSKCRDGSRHIRLRSRSVHLDHKSDRPRRLF